MTAYFNPTTLNISQYVYSWIAEHKQSRRIWLEGQRLADAGFMKGAKCRVDLDPINQLLTISLDEQGTKTVSGRVKTSTGVVTPIIDLLNKNLAPAGTRIRALFMKGKILVTLHHEEQKRWDRERRLMEVVTGQRELKKGTLCAGIGVSTAAAQDALENAGIKSHVDWLVDIEQKYLEVAVKNNPAVTSKTQLFVASLEELEPELLTNVDFLSVSLPCTGFSLSGRAKLGLKFGEAHPEAATSVFGFMQIVKKVNPGIILSENVSQARGSATYHLIISELERIGYKVNEMIMDGDDAGTIENRERYFFVAVSSGLADCFDFDSLVPRQRVYQSMGEIKDPVADDDPMWKPYDYLEAKAIRDEAAGKGFKRQLINATTRSIGVVGRHYNKARSTEPFWVREDGMQRLLTKFEHAKAKLVPLSLIAGLKPTLAHEGLGQGVLYPHIIMLVERIVEGMRSLKSKVGGFLSKPLYLAA